MSDWKPGKILPENFIVEEILGAGAMGTVYLVSRRVSRGTLQFAVKTLRTDQDLSASYQSLFLHELRNWIEIPDHPNITACRFYRSIDSELAIFSEYVKGGTLQSWIRGGKMNDATHLLDIAIQVAQGLQVAHDCGVIHQDIKSSNILMTEAGIAKITDFGLSGLKNPDRQKHVQSSGNDTILVSSHGMTPAYCSPEQTNLGNIGRATDVWSLGVTILEMFVGEVSWSLGVMAPDILKNYIQTPSKLSIPQSVADVLTRCFAFKPENRWPGMDVLAYALIEAHQTITGEAYPRQAPILGPRVQRAIKQKRMMRGEQILQPLKWLTFALDLDGQDSSQAESLLPTESESGFARMLGYLKIYETVDRILSRHLAKGEQSLRKDFSTVLFEKSVTHTNTGDNPGAIECFDRIDAMLDEVILTEPDDKYRNRKAVALMEKANVVSYTDLNAAIKLYEQAAEKLKSLPDREDSAPVLDNLSKALAGKGNALCRTDKIKNAQRCYDQAINYTRMLVWSTKKGPVEHGLAGLLGNRGFILTLLDDPAAETDFLEAIDLLEKSVYLDQHADNIHSLANVYGNYGQFLRKNKKLEKAQESLVKAVEIVESLVREEGERVFAPLLYMNQTIFIDILVDRKQFAQADALSRKTIDLLERMVYLHGKSEHVRTLISAYQTAVSIKFQLEDFGAALKLVEIPLGILQSEVSEIKRMGCHRLLAVTWIQKAEILKAMNRPEDACGLAHKAKNILESKDLSADQATSAHLLTRVEKLL